MSDLKQTTVTGDLPSHLAWAEGMRCRLPQAVLTETGLNRYLRPDGKLALPSDLGSVRNIAVDALRLRVAFTPRAPVSSRLPISYRRVPGVLRSILARCLGRHRRRLLDRSTFFPAWPLDLSTDFLADLSSGAPGPFAGSRTPVVLTHDLDSPEGMTNLVGSFLDVEESVGARSTSFVVPCDWPIDHGLLEEIAARGHELGIHGYDHANRTAFLPPVPQRHRLAAAAGLIERYGMTGYRAPSLCRTPSLLRSLSGIYRYDSSIPTSGGLFPVPGNGCASARPFVVEGIAELPLSLPRDGSLRFLGYSPEEIFTLWKDCARQIAASGGVVVLLTHCERRFSGNAEMLEVYQRFLDYIVESPQFTWSTPDEVLDRVFVSNASDRSRTAASGRARTCVSAEDPACLTGAC